MLQLTSQRGAARAADDTVPRDLVFTFSYMTWETAAARGLFGAEDRLLETLLDHERVGRMLVVNQMRSAPLKLARALTRRGGATPLPAADRHTLVEPLRLRRSDPRGARGLTQTYARYDRVLRRAVAAHGLERPAVVTAHPLVAGFADLDWAASVTYYAIDDWAAHPAYRRLWPAYREAYARIRARGTRVCAISDVVLDRVAPAGPSVVMPNGLSPREWSAPVAPAWAKGPGPLLVYAGTLDSRLDVGAILRLAAALPDARIVLVGPLVEPAHLAPLRGLANVELRPAMARAEITGLIAAADVGLIPHADSALTQGMSPLKLYEYLAGGLPVVATDLPPIRGIDPRVVVVPAGGDFAAGAQRALALGRAPEPERLAFVAANSWRSRHERLLDLALAA